jgi:hypothetical protein
MRRNEYAAAAIAQMLGDEHDDDLARRRLRGGRVKTVVKRVAINDPDRGRRFR